MDQGTADQFQTGADGLAGQPRPAQSLGPDSTASSTSTMTMDTMMEDQAVLVLVGLPGSAKSTLSNALAQYSSTREWNDPDPFTGTAHPSITMDPSSSALPAASSGRSTDSPSGPRRIRRRWTRVSQDEAPSRRRQEVEYGLRQALARGENVVVDRVNFDPSQRAHFIAIAEAHVPKPRIYALILDVSLPTLHRRLAVRQTHPTIPDAETGARVLAQMSTTWSPPRPRQRSEGFDRVYTLPETQQPADGVWSLGGVRAVLDDVASRGELETGPRVKMVAGEGYAGGHGGRGRGRGWGDWNGYGRGGGGDWRGGSGHGRGYGRGAGRAHGQRDGDGGGYIQPRSTAPGQGYPDGRWLNGYAQPGPYRQDEPPRSYHG